MCAAQSRQEEEQQQLQARLECEAERGHQLSSTMQRIAGRIVSLVPSVSLSLDPALLTAVRKSGAEDADAQTDGAANNEKCAEIILHAVDQLRGTLQPICSQHVTHTHTHTHAHVLLLRGHRPTEV